MTKIYNISGKWNNDFTTEVFEKQNVWSGKLIVNESGQARGLILFPYRKFAKQRYVEGIFDDSILEFTQYSIKNPEAIVDYKCVKKDMEFVGYVEKDGEENNIVGRCSVLLQEVMDFSLEALENFASTINIYHERCVGEDCKEQNLLLLPHFFPSSAEE